jgi:cytochrome P450
MIEQQSSPIPAHVPAGLVVDFDIFNPTLNDEEIFAMWRKLQSGDEAPLRWTPHNGGHWIAVRAEDIAVMFDDAKRFSSKSVGIPAGKLPMRILPIESDPPEHGAYRAIMNPALGPRRVVELTQRARSVAIELIEGFRGRGHCEFVADFAKHLPIIVFMHLVDLPERDRMSLLSFSEKMHHSPKVEERQQAFMDLNRYLDFWIEERRRSPGEDLISRIVNARIDGRAMSEEEIRGYLSTVLFGGLDTVASTLGFVALFLATHPDHRRQLIEERALIPRATEELLRRFAVAAPARVATHDFTYKGVAIRGGESIQLAGLLYNLDERRFVDAMTVDFRREIPAIGTFGFGPHRCPGAVLARAELRVLLEEWLPRIPEFSLTGGERPEYAGGMGVSIVRLPLSWPAAES